MMALISESNAEFTPVPAAAGAAAARTAGAGAAVGASAAVDDGAAAAVVGDTVVDDAAGTAADGLALGFANTVRETDERACAAE